MARFQVSQAAAHELLPACRLLFNDGAERGRELMRTESDATGLFVARDSDGKLHAAALVQVIPGALGVAWPPRGDSREAEDAVTRAACEWLRSRGVKVCQAFVSAGEALDVAPLERSGFRHTTQLVMLRREIDPARDRLRSADYPSGVYYQPEFREKFAAALLATYEGTYDCPELNGDRTGAELLAGFELPERSVSSWHFLAESDGKPVGVVVMNPGAGLELTYIGVVPGSRGRGFGDRLLRLVFHEATCARFDAVTLSVDARNIPATRLYARHGFVEYDRREVWLASWPT
jgi:ribosomal protein S18 acetylase RimI-like enzyme